MTKKRENGNFKFIFVHIDSITYLYVIVKASKNACCKYNLHIHLNYSYFHFVIDSLPMLRQVMFILAFELDSHLEQKKGPDPLVIHRTQLTL